MLQRFDDTIPFAEAMRRRLAATVAALDDLVRQADVLQGLVRDMQAQLRVPNSVSLPLTTFDHAIDRYITDVNNRAVEGP